MLGSTWLRESRAFVSVTLHCCSLSLSVKAWAGNIEYLGLISCFLFQEFIVFSFDDS